VMVRVSVGGTGMCAGKKEKKRGRKEERKESPSKSLIFEQNSVQDFRGSDGKSKPQFCMSELICFLVPQN
jgi:hypothetical protein